MRGAARAAGEQTAQTRRCKNPSVSRRRGARLHRARARTSWPDRSTHNAQGGRRHSNGCTLNQGLCAAWVRGWPRCGAPPWRGLTRLPRRNTAGCCSAQSQTPLQLRRVLISCWVYRMPAYATVLGATLGAGVQLYSNAARKLPLLRSASLGHTERMLAGPQL